MRQITKFDQLSGESKKITLIKIVETDKSGNTHEHEMQLRHALQAMRVQPSRFKLASGEKLPKGVSVDMVPAGTTLDDVKKFEKTRGTIGKATKTNFDNVLDAIEKGVEIDDVEVFSADAEANVGAEQDEPTVPPDYVPGEVDLKPADSMLSDEEKHLDNTSKEEPALNELKEKELDFSDGADTTTNYTKADLKDLSKDKLQATLSALPAFKKMSDKMQKQVMRSKKDNLIDSILHLSKKKK